MEYTIAKLENAQSKVTFTVDTAEWVAARTKAYQKTKGQYKVSGFRPGKAPQKTIERMYGESCFYEEAIDILLEEGYKKLLDENPDLVPVTRPEVSIDVVNSEKLEFSLTIQEMPEIEIEQYKGLGIKRVAPAEITDEQVEKEVDQARERLATWVPVTDRAAEMGDKANIDYKGLKDGEAFAGGTAEKHDLELGSHSFIPGFEEGVVGMQIGEEKEIPLSFPEDYGAKELAGQAVVFVVKLNSLDTKVVPEADDDFAKDLGEYDTIADYRAAIRSRLTEQAQQTADGETENAVLNAVNDHSTVTLPKEVIEERAEQMVKDFGQRLASQGLQLDMYYKYTGTTPESLKEQYMPQAEKSVRMELIIAKVAKLENMAFDPAEYDKVVEKLFAMYGNDPDKTLEDFAADVKANPNLNGYVEEQALTETVIRFLINANVVD